MSNALMNEIPYKIEKSKAMKPFWEGLNNGELNTTQCNNCKSIHYPPSPILCTSCFGHDIEWLTLPLSGTLTTFTHVTAPPVGFKRDYVLASVVIDKLEKPILGRYEGSEPTIGDRVKVTFEKIGDQSIFVFSPDT